jgi:hypothetical protein
MHNSPDVKVLDEVSSSKGWDMAKQIDVLQRLRIRSLDANRVFDSLTHPTSTRWDDPELRRGSASRLTFKSNCKVPAELCLLLDILVEEFRGTATAAEITVDNALERTMRTMYPAPVMREKLPSFIGDEEIPQAPIALVCEFTLLIAETIKSTGRQVAVVFDELTMMTTQPKVHHVGQYGERPRSEAEASGVWRSADRHKGTRRAKGQNHLKTG